MKMFGRRQCGAGAVMVLAVVAAGLIAFSFMTRDRNKAFVGGQELAPVLNRRRLMEETTDVCDDYDGKARDLCMNYCYEKACYKQGHPSCGALKSDFFELSRHRSMPCDGGCPCWEASELDAFLLTVHEPLLCNQKATYDEIVADSAGPLNSFLAQSADDLPKMCMNFVAAPTIVRHITGSQAQRCRAQIRERCQHVGGSTTARRLEEEDFSTSGDSTTR